MGGKKKRRKEEEEKEEGEEEEEQGTLRFFHESPHSYPVFPVVCAGELLRDVICTRHPHRDARGFRLPFFTFKFQYFLGTGCFST